MKNAWFNEYLAGGTSARPFSFTYHGQPSTKWLALWPTKVTDERLDGNRARRTLTWTDPRTGLEVRCVAVDYADYPVVEWTVWFMNTGTADTPILEDIQGLDMRLNRTAADPEYVLHGIKGDFESAEGYEPYERVLAARSAVAFAPPDWSGKSCDGPVGWPYFNLQTSGRAWVEFYDNLAAAIREGAPPSITPESVRETIAVLETCRRQNPAIWEGL